MGQWRSRKIEVLEEPLEEKLGHIFQRLPVELVRRVFELAATSRAMAGTLVVVSKTTFQWITPIIYRTIIFDNQYTLDVYAWNRRARRPPRRRVTETRNLFFAPQMDGVALKFDEFVGLKNIVVNPTTFSNLDWQVIPSLIHLTIPVRIDMVPFGRPFLQTITHLYLPWDLPAERGNMTFTPTALPSLTHFVCSVPPHTRSADRAGVREFYIRVLTKFKTLRVFGIQAFSSPYTDKDIAQYLHNLDISHDPRLVFISRKEFTVNVWQDWLSGGESIWDAAEQMLASQDRTCPLGLLMG